MSTQGWPHARWIKHSPRDKKGAFGETDAGLGPVGQAELTFNEE